MSSFVAIRSNFLSNNLSISFTTSLSSNLISKPLLFDDFFEFWRCSGELSDHPCLPPAIGEKYFPMSDMKNNTHGYSFILLKKLDKMTIKNSVKKKQKKKTKKNAAYKSSIITRN